MAFARPLEDGSVPIPARRRCATAPASTVPHKIMPDGVLAVARCLPLTHVVTLLKAMWLGWAGQTWLPSSIVPFARKTPYRDLSTTLAILVKNRNWQWINGLTVLGASAGLLGQASICIFQLPKAGSFAVAGYFIATLGTALLAGTMLWDTILWPILVNHDESLLSFQGPDYVSRTFLTFFVASGLIYSAGFVLVGIGIVQANTLPSAACCLVVVGAPLFGLGAMSEWFVHDSLYVVIC